MAPALSRADAGWAVPRRTLDLPATIRHIAYACAVGCIAALAGPVAAHAAKVDADDDISAIVYDAESGETNAIAIAQSGDEFSVSDGGVAAISPNNTCVAVLNTATCTLPGASSVRVNALGGDDSVATNTAVPARVNGGGGNDALATGAGDDRIDGGNGNDKMAGGAGADTFVGGDGNDTIASRDGVAETVDCGIGSDTVDADPVDILTGCEGGGSGSGEMPPIDGLPPLPGQGPSGGETGTGPSGGGTGGGEDSEADHGIVLGPSPLEMRRRHWALVHLVCSASALEDCRGEIFLSIVRRAKLRRGQRVSSSRAGHTARQCRIGRSRFRIEPGKSLDVKVRINERGHAILRSKRRQRGRLRIVHRDAAGTVTGVTTRSVVYTARKWGRRKARRRR
jgi:hypothetical protein